MRAEGESTGKGAGSSRGSTRSSLANRRRRRSWESLPIIREGVQELQEFRAATEAEAEYLARIERARIAAQMLQ